MAMQSPDWPFKIVPTGCPETSISIYQRKVRNIPEERRSQHKYTQLFHEHNNSIKALKVRGEFS